MKKAHRNVFDLETAGFPEADIIHLAPKFEAPSNYKDPEKIAANLAEQKANWVKRAALSPITGRVLAIGIKPRDALPLIFEAPTPEDEGSLITGFWDYVNANEFWSTMEGWNVEGFDLPFLIKRSWKLRIPVPMALVMNGRYLSHRFVDLMKTFQAPNYREDFTSLDTAAKFLGVGAKTGSGAHFAETYVKDRAAALAYLENDLGLTEAVADVLIPDAVQDAARVA